MFHKALAKHIFPCCFSSCFLCLPTLQKQPECLAAWTQQPSHKSLAVIPVLKAVKGLLGEKLSLASALPLV